MIVPYMSPGHILIGFEKTVHCYCSIYYACTQRYVKLLTCKECSPAHGSPYHQSIR